MDMTPEYWISLALSNFALSMFILSLFFMLLNRLITRGRVSGAEIAYRWTALFTLGVTSVYAFIMHAFFQDIASAAIGWSPSPFEYEVAMANLAIGVIAILSFNASYNFRLAVVIGATIWLWGDATGHIYQLIKNQNYSIGNVGSWFWMDLYIPLLLIICINKLKPVTVKKSF